MADGDNKNKVEIEVAIRDMFSTTLKTMGRELDALNKRATETGVSGAGGFDKFRRSNDQLNESNKRTTASFSAMSVVTSTLTRGLLGTAGLAYGFYSVSKAIEDVSVNAIKLKNFSTDTGFAISKVQDLQQTLRLGGFSKSEGDSVIGAMGSMANNLAAFKESSDIYQKLILAPGGAALATNLVNIAKTGDQAKVVSEFLKVFSRQSREAKFFMAEAAGTTISALEAMANTANKNRHVKLWPIDQEEANKMHELWLDMEDNFTNIFTNISNHGIKAFNELTQAFTAQGVTTRGIAAWVNNETDQLFATIRQTMDEIKSIREWYDSVSKGGEEGKKAALNTPTIGKQPFGPSFDFLNKTPADFLRGGRKEGAYPQGEDPMGKDYTARSISSYFQKRSDIGTSGSTDFSGRARSDDGVNILTDIRDTLQRIEIGGSGGGSGGSGGGTYGTGARGAALRAGLGGFRPGSTHSPIRASGAGGFRPSHAGADDTPAGSGPPAAGIPADKQHVASIIAEEWRKTGMSEKGIAGIMANVQDESRFNPTLRHPDQPKFSGEAHYAHGLYQEGGTEWNNYKAWLDKNYPNSDWKDPRLQSRFAAERLRSGYPKAWKQMNEAGTAGEAGAAYVDQYLRPAAGYRAERMNRYRRGVPGVEHYTGAEDRARMDERASIDKAQSGGGAFAKGAVNAKVEFLNVPPGVRTNADVEGDVFKDLQISKTKQSGVYRQTGQSYD